MATTWRWVSDSRPVGWLAARLSLERRAVVGVLSATLLGLVARLAWLGSRPMHFDEARVAYWILRANRTGHWQYRYIIHGPFVQHVNRFLFEWFGPGDFVARLPVALVGAGLPLAALLFRDRLRDLEVAALAGFLALNPMLLYYSRFMRSDLLVGAFAFVSLGFLVRLYDTGRLRYLHAGVLAFALAFASKENAIVYVLCWIGMLGLVAGLEVLEPRRFTTRAHLFRTVLDRAGAIRDRADVRWGLFVLANAVGAVLLFGVVTLLMFAPRAPVGEGVGLYNSSLSAILDATARSMEGGYRHWVGGSGDPAECLSRDTPSYWGKYVCNLGRELSSLGRTSTTVAVLAALGVAAEFRRERPRVLVPAAFYWGVASLVGYPLGADIIFPPWITLHAVIPLTIPAAAGLVVLGGWLHEAVVERDGVTASVTAVATAVLLVSTLAIGAQFAFLAPTAYTYGSPAMVQYAQPDHEMRGALDATQAAALSNEGLDVAVYDTGETTLVDMGAGNDRTIDCMKFLRATPISWYLYAWEADVDCADDPTRLQPLLDRDPPVVVTEPKHLPDVERHLDGDYVVARYDNRRGNRPVVFVFDVDRTDPPRRAVPLEDA